MFAARHVLMASTLLTVCSPVLAQPALERLEKQLQPGAGDVAPQPARETGYLGAITRDESGGFIRVVEVVSDGPAAQAGLGAGDLILGVDGRLTRQMNDLAGVLKGLSPGARISLAVQRGQQERTVAVTLGRRPPPSEGPTLISPQAANPPAETTARRPTAPLAAEGIDAPRPGEPRGDQARINLLERRVAELERRLAELELLLNRRP